MAYLKLRTNDLGSGAENPTQARLELNWLSSNFKIKV